MAANKSKRSIHLAQPLPQRPRPNHKPADLQHVKTRVYRAMADINSGFDHVLQGLQTLNTIKFLQSSGFKGMDNLIGRLRAQANHELTAILSQREKSNAGHFQRLCMAQEIGKPEAATS
jgi:hypothetical protein